MGFKVDTAVPPAVPAVAGLTGARLLIMLGSMFFINSAVCSAFSSVSTVSGATAPGTAAAPDGVSPMATLVASAVAITLAGTPIVARYAVSTAVHPCAAFSAAIGSRVALAIAMVSAVRPPEAAILAASTVPATMPAALLAMAAAPASVIPAVCNALVISAALAPASAMLAAVLAASPALKAPAPASANKLET